MEPLELDDFQGLIAKGYGPLRAARFLLLGFPSPAGARAWLGEIADRVTDAVKKNPTAVNVGITAAGLEAVGLPADGLAGFSLEFRAGFSSAQRLRAMSDVGPDAPEHWSWGAPGMPRIDAVLLLYATDAPTLAALVAEQEQGLARAGVAVLHALETSDYGDREPFGFRDGISQPGVEGFGRESTPSNTLKAGEFVLGYPNEYGLLTDRPLVDANADPKGLLPDDAEGSKRKDLGRNGSYLVMRQLAQDVPGFWKTMHERAKGADGAADEARRTFLAAKMVGRWPGGAPLTLSPEHDEPALGDANDFGYHANDADGLGCPVGAHVRRTNPRDTLDPKPGSEASLALNRRHRILRRGRPYGTPISIEQALQGGPEAEGDRGLYFMCVNANIARQFEFVQHTWANNPRFAGLSDGVDPMTGPRGEHGASFSIPAVPVRERLTGLPSFVATKGSAYFFLPGIRALRYLASLG